MRADIRAARPMATRAAQRTRCPAARCTGGAPSAAGVADGRARRARRPGIKTPHSYEACPKSMKGPFRSAHTRARSTLPKASSHTSSPCPLFMGNKASNQTSGLPIRAPQLSTQVCCLHERSSFFRKVFFSRASASCFNPAEPRSAPTWCHSFEVWPCEQDGVTCDAFIQL